jgi:hypothetical protein
MPECQLLGFYSFKSLPWTLALRGGNNVSHKQTFLFSDECPPVAIRLDDPTNATSLVVLLWHFKLLKTKVNKIWIYTAVNYKYY